MSKQQLADLREQLTAITDQFRNLIESAGAAAALARPHPGAWSVADCMVHLALSTESFLPQWSSALAIARRTPDRSERHWKRDWIGRLLAWSLEPPVRMGMKATAALPAGSHDAVQALSMFADSQDQLFALLDGTERLPLDRVRVVSPFASQVRYSVWSSFLITAAHERRHLWQAQRVLSSVK